MRQRRPASFFPILLALPAAVSVGLLQAASAEQGRRSNHRSQPTPLARTAPDVTATIPADKPAVTEGTADAPLKPFFLPAAPRSRMRACGQKWQDVKLSGRAGDETWRDFATKCLAEREEAAKKAKP